MSGCCTEVENNRRTEGMPRCMLLQDTFTDLHAGLQPLWYTKCMYIHTHIYNNIHTHTHTYRVFASVSYLYKQADPAQTG